VNLSVNVFNCSAAGNTVIYSLAGIQNVVIPSDLSYSNLTLSGGNTKSLNTGTHTIGGNLTIASATTLATIGNSMIIKGNFTNNGTFIAAASTVTLSGTIAQLISGTSATAFNNLTITNSSAIVSAATNFSVGITLSVGAGAILSPNAAVIVSGAGTLTGNGTARVTRIAATPDFISQYTITTKTLTNLTVDYIGAGNQTVNTLNYSSLTVSNNGTRTVTFLPAIVGISKVFLPSLVTTNYIVTGNTINFNGLLAQVIPAFTYYNMTTAGIGAKTLSGNIVMQNTLTITSNLDVTASDFSITVGKNWIKNGTFNGRAGTVTFNGSTAQTLSGTGTTAFENLGIANTGGGVAISTGIYQLTGAILPTNGNFNTNGQVFTMISDASKTARIGQKASSASLSGNFIIQRYIGGRDTSYSDLSSTVQGATLSDWDNELPAISYVHSPPYTLASAYTYDETLDTFLAVTSSGASLTAGKGFEVFLAGDFAYAAFPNTTMDVVGIPNQGTFNLSGLISNNAQGWNLVGNPFASNISWASVYTASGAAASGLYDFIEMYDYTIGDWHGYTSGDGIEIGSAQGFWVYGLPGATSLTLTIPESAKTTTSNSSIKATTLTPPFFTLKISNDQNAFSHTFKVASSYEAKDGFDLKDLPFRPSPNKATPELYSVVDGKALNLNSFDLSDDAYSIPLQTKAGFSGNYMLEAGGFDFVNEYQCIQLEDKLKHTFVNLRGKNTYEFEMTTTDNPDRFTLHFSKPKDCKMAVSNSQNSDLASNVSIFPTTEGNVINFNFVKNTAVQVRVLNMIGQEIVREKNLEVGIQSMNIQLPENFVGMYMINVVSENGTLTKKFVKK